MQDKAIYNIAEDECAITFFFKPKKIGVSKTNGGNILAFDYTMLASQSMNSCYHQLYLEHILRDFADVIREHYKKNNPNYFYEEKFPENRLEE